MFRRHRRRRGEGGIRPDLVTSGQLSGKHQRHDQHLPAPDSHQHRNESVDQAGKPDPAAPVVEALDERRILLPPSKKPAPRPPCRHPRHQRQANRENEPRLLGRYVLGAIISRLQPRAEASLREVGFRMELAGAVDRGAIVTVEIGPFFPTALPAPDRARWLARHSVGRCAAWPALSSAEERA
jgi:hypothetical protein